ncbi:hypothetical protein PTKIN_Ptkin03bG0092400 [Pterospermum kingtungense]
MNIEPAMLLMVCSLPKYIDFTHSLLEFLLLFVDNYDLYHKNIITRGKVLRDVLSVDLPSYSTPSLRLPEESCIGSPTPSLKKQLRCDGKDRLSTRAVVASILVLDISVNTSTFYVIAGDNEVHVYYLMLQVDWEIQLLLQKRKEDSTEAFVSASEMEEKSTANLVDSAFTAYKCFILSSTTILHKEADSFHLKLLFSDLKNCFDCKRIKMKNLFCNIFCYLLDLSISEEDIIRLLIEKLDYVDLMEMLFDIGLKKFSLFGDNPKPIFHLIKNSLNWNCLEQHKFWALVRSELSVSEVQVDKIISKFFCFGEIDVNLSALAIEGLLTLCSSCTPTPELVSTIVSLPNNLFQDFAAATLATRALQCYLTA